MSPRTGIRASIADGLADAIVTANRVLVELSAHCLDSFSPRINLSEFRALVLLSDHGPQRLIDIAAALDVTSTTATRLADRLTNSGLVDRVRQSRDRREIHLAIADPGRALVSAVRSTRRRHVAHALAEFTEREQEAAVRVLDRLGETGPRCEEESA